MTPPVQHIVHIKVWLSSRDFAPQPTAQADLEKLCIFLLLIPASVQSQGIDEPMNNINVEGAGTTEKEIKENTNDINANKTATPIIENESQVKSNENSTQPTEVLTPKNNGWDTANTFMVICTAIMAICTFGLWRETRRTVKSNKGVTKGSHLNY